MSEIRRHRLPNAQEWPKAIFSNLKKYLDKTESFEGYLRKNNYAVIFFIKQICYFEVSYFSSGLKFQKKLLAIMKSIKLGRQPKFQKFLATGGLVIPGRRLIGGEKFEIYLIFINFFYRKL